MAHLIWFRAIWEKTVFTNAWSLLHLFSCFAWRKLISKKCFFPSFFHFSLSLLENMAFSHSMRVLSMSFVSNLAWFKVTKPSREFEKRKKRLYVMQWISHSLRSVVFFLYYHCNPKISCQQWYIYIYQIYRFYITYKICNMRFLIRPIIYELVSAEFTDQKFH